MGWFGVRSGGIRRWKCDNWIWNWDLICVACQEVRRCRKKWIKHYFRWLDSSISKKKKNTKPQQLITIMSVSGQIGPRWRTRETAIQMIQAAEMSFFQRVAGDSLGDGVRSSVIQEWLKVEPLLVHFERNQLRWTSLLRLLPPQPGPG